jgi:hypothetical protein
MIAAVTRPEVTAFTEADLADAHRLSGQSWHALGPEEVARAIELQHIKHLIKPAVHLQPEHGPGQHLVGPVAIPA